MFTDLEFIKTCLNGLRSRIEAEIADLPQPDWNQNDDTQPDYVKNRPFYTGDPVETVYVKEHTVMFDNNGDGLYVGILQSAFKATVGETYKISWDGTVYECVCVDFSGVLAFGNFSIVDSGSDTGEPFVIIVVNGEVALGTTDTSASHTFSISKMVVPVVKIDSKYLPDTPLSFKPAGKSYLTFSSLSSFTLAVYGATKHWDGTLEYFASGRTWTAWDGSTTLSAVDDDGAYVLYLRGTGNTIITGNDNYYRWVLTGTDIRCIGNIENLLDYATVESGGHPTMAPYCYHYMFEDCTSLTQAPALPATTLAPYCYGSMFLRCRALTQAPALPATTLAPYCYGGMFDGCRALTQAPALPATTLAPYCYGSMFLRCRALIQAPALPATTLAPYCYHYMFEDCTSLTQAPALPATTLAEGCYASMFYHCTSLKLSTTQTGEYTQEYRIPSSGEGTTASDALNYMFDSTGGTFTGTPAINETYYLSSDNMVVHDTKVATLREYVGSMIDFAIGEYGVSNIDRANWNAKASKPKACLVILGSSDWDATAKTQVVAVSSVVADEATQMIHTMPKIGQVTDYNNAGIQLVGRGAGNVTFMCDTIPEKDIEVWVVTEDVEDVTPLPYLTFSSPQPFTLKAASGKQWNGTLEYSYDTSTWTTWDGSTSLQPPEGYRLYMRGIGNTKITGFFASSRWELTGTDIACTGNIENLLDYNAVKRGKHPVMAAYCYSSMFSGCTSLTTAPELPATTLTKGCYDNMFERCVNLTTAPELPATTLAESCYHTMFRRCTSLTTAPELPATTLAVSCYDSMFEECYKLTTAPELPATTLAKHCYDQMFRSCGFTTAPELPATTLADSCYSWMFIYCRSLTTAPSLPATTLAAGCYNSMFQGCSSLTTAPELPATMLAAGCYGSMFEECRWLTTAPSLPATTLAKNCYADMFYNCERLTTAPELPATTLATGCYRSMFKGCTSLTTAPELPATTLADGCYNEMFRGCDRLTTAPELPATTLADGCYHSMFQGCSRLTTAPSLPATTLATNCYSSMFYSCTSLATAPSLPVTTLADGCYDGMFYQCTSLTTAPELPATTLATGCYRSMFKGCTSLTTAPELPATTLTRNCYSSMFEGCTRLTTAPSLPVTTLAENCYYFMFNGCTSLTTAPELPATTLNGYCYYGMFKGCTSLTAAPSLPATTLAEGCYSCMFQGCESLTTAPELPATTLAGNCYISMFERCINLTTAPELPATTLYAYCYTYMFTGCTGLTTIPELPATTLTKSCYEGMFKGCTRLKLSTTATDSYTIAYRIPSAGEGTAGQDSLTNMFTNTGGTFVGTPEINTTYYLDKSNSIV